MIYLILGAYALLLLAASVVGDWRHNEILFAGRGNRG